MSIIMPNESMLIIPNDHFKLIFYFLSKLQELIHVQELPMEGLASYKFFFSIFDYESNLPTNDQFLLWRRFQRYFDMLALFHSLFLMSLRPSSSLGTHTSSQATLVYFMFKLIPSQKKALKIESNSPWTLKGMMKMED